MALILPEHVDVERLAGPETVLEGEYPAAVLRRLTEAFTDVQPVAASVAFTRGDDRRVVVRGRVNGRVTAICQRCLQPVVLAVTGEFEHLPAAEEMLETGPAGPGTLNLLALVEDEFLLACPMIPKHPAACPMPAGSDGVISEDTAVKSENPFDVLAALRQNTGDESRGTAAASNSEE